jgi:DNA-binding NtrC family response regulator
VTLREIVQKAERDAIVAVLQRQLGRTRIRDTAKSLGINRKTLWEKMKRYKIDKALAHPQQSLPLEQAA